MRPILVSFLFLLSLALSAQTKPVTLKICDLKPVDYKLPEVDYLKAFEARCSTGIEAWSDKKYKLVQPGFHPFVQAVHNAYALHRPLVISPDMVWLMIAQGFAKHVDENGEKLRKHFVDFDGKKVLKVKRDNFVKGSAGNDWEGVFPEFTAQIGKHTGKELLNTTLLNFSTTGKAEKAAFEVTLMDAMSSYFIYAVYTDCGITEITLEGTTKDWELILEKTKALEKYELKWWTDELVPVLEKFVDASKGNTDKDFWAQIYKQHSPGSGTPYNTGWINKFFPYIVQGEKMVKNTSIKDGSLTTDNYPSGMSKADFYWIYFGSCYQMEFLAGFVGVKQDPVTLALRPEIGWAIRDSGKSGIKKEDEKYMKDILTPP
jgi:hypothetical protein